MSRRPPRGGIAHQLRRRDEGGYVAILVALMFATVLIGLAAIGVDVGRWSMQMERLQKAADAAALAGVTYLPNDLTTARSTAVAVAMRNGISDASMITVTQGARSSELVVTVRARVPNTFGAVLGYGNTTVARSATADYTAPAPMGSPCNTFGNEPRGSTTESAQPIGTALGRTSTTFPNCPVDVVTGTSQPKFWSAIEGPETDKLQGDRYQTNLCAEVGNASKTAAGCVAGRNTERRDDGYYYNIHVESEVVRAGATIDVQVYDPAFANTGVYCGSLPTSGSLVDDMNPFSRDGRKRYGRVLRVGVANATEGAEEFCPGDTSPGSTAAATATTTTYVMRGRTDTGDPANAPVLTTCDRYQFRGGSAPSASQLRSGNSAYNAELARVFHQWFSICSFKPDRAGDYFLQVRSNVALPSQAFAYSANNAQQNFIYKNNPAAILATPTLTTGAGANAFSLRAVTSSDSTRTKVSVSSWERMPLLQIAPGTASFNLVRALPNAKGQYVAFEFFDAADGSTGTVKVLPPGDATGDIASSSGVPGCRAGLNDAAPATYATLSGCSYAVDGRVTDGQVVHMVIPIPNNYSCDNSDLRGCWFRVEMNYGGSVTDLTTWSATIGGDPVRLIR